MQPKPDEGFRALQGGPVQMLDMSSGTSAPLCPSPTCISRVVYRFYVWPLFTWFDSCCRAGDPRGHECCRTYPDLLGPRHECGSSHTERNR